MGLDGISTNQLRFLNEQNSNELNNVPAQQINPKHIDGMSSGQRINPDDKKEKQNSEFSEDEEENQETDDKENEIEESIKYDLSDTKRYLLKVDDDTNNILIIEKQTNKIIQIFNPESLSNLTKYLDNFTGALINRKY